VSSSRKLRTEIEQLLREGEWHKAHLYLGDLWREEGKTSVTGFISSCYERLRDHISLVKCRVFVLRSMTVEPLLPILRCAGLVAGIDIAAQPGQFNAYAQEILDPASQLYSFDPDLAILAVQARDFVPELWDYYTDLSSTEVQLAVDRVLAEFANLIHTFRQNSRASLIIHTLEKPFASAGILDVQTRAGQLAAIDQINKGLQKLCTDARSVYLLDYEDLIARHGRNRWHDEAKSLTLRMPFASDSVVAMVSEWLKFVHPVSGVSCKVLVVDLDNTLWGGVLGEDGRESLQIGTEYPGAFYRSLQRAVLDLRNRGILLAVCSKNSHDEALAILRDHPGMLLRPEHFAAFRINWKDKAENLRDIAKELNVGLDSMAFLDDNQVERDRIRMGLSEVKVIDLPPHAQGYAGALRSCPLFERLSISAEDRELTQLYHDRQKRTQLAQSVGSLEDFYRSLDQVVSISPVTSEMITRVSQLTRKTNQFNVTTRRYNEQEIEKFMSQPEYGVYAVRVTDRFGDNGIVGVVITRMSGVVCEIETFLLSCRVIGRTIETAMLGYLAENSKSVGVRFLQGWIIPTQKNSPVQGLYLSHQFQPVAADGDAVLWRLNLSELAITLPTWIRTCFIPGTCSAEPRHA
jgi:FkbH-like protein